MFLCIYSDFGVLIYKGFEFFFFFKTIYGPRNGLGFLELKLLYVFFVKNLRGLVIKFFLFFFFFTTIGGIFQNSRGAMAPLCPLALPLTASQDDNLLSTTRFHNSITELTKR